MTITEQKHDNVYEFVIDGNLDTTTSPDLEKRFSAITPDITEIVFDFSNLTYISSAGLRTILYANETIGEGGTLTIKGANPMVRDIFDTTGFSDMLNILD